jgi:rhodanese-related sulfurtransferase
MDRLLEYVGHHTALTLATVAIALLVAANEYFLKLMGRNSISPQQLVQLMNQGALVLDARSQEEFATGHIGGAKQLTPDLLSKAADAFKRHRGKPVVVYGANDRSGQSIVRQLTAQGFTQPMCLRGGLPTWRAENLPLSKS